MYHHHDAIQLIEDRFPDLADELHDEIDDDLLHLQMAVFSRFAQTVIDFGDKATWQQVTAAFMDLWQDCDADVRNALNVSFLEHINFQDGKRSREWAFSAMPKAMQQAWQVPVHSPLAVF